MKLGHLFVTALAATGLQQAVVGQMANQVSMCVTTGIGTCGNLCEPFACTPNYTLASSSELVRFDVAGAPMMPYVLFAGIAVPGCLPVPGIEGMMATWTPAAVIKIGSFGPDQHVSMACLPATDAYTMAFPTVPPGIDIRFQLLGVNAYAGAPRLSLSRATEIRAR